MDTTRMTTTSDTTGTDRSLDDLRKEALASIPSSRAGETADEHRMINRSFSGSYGSPDYALRSLVTHLPNHHAYYITEAVRLATEAKLPETTPLTDDHITVCDKLSQEVNDRGETIYQDGTSYTTDYTERDKIISYAMHHIDDGHLIVSMVYERGIRTLDKMLDLLTVLKEVKHGTLVEGML